PSDPATPVTTTVRTALPCPNGQREGHHGRGPTVSSIGPFEGGTPSGGGGPFEDLMRNLARLLTSQGPINWEIARQMAQWAATGGESEANPDPVARVRIEELLRVAELHIGEATGLPVSTGGLLSA